MTLRRLAPLLLLLAACEEPVTHLGEPYIVYPADAGPEVTADARDESLCAIPLACPPASPGRASLCGRIFDVETGAPVGSAEPSQVCTSTAQGGACLFQMTPYSALDFAQDQGIPPQVYESLEIDTCGRYRLVDVVVPSLGYLGLLVDDASGAADVTRPTGVALQVISREVREDFGAYAVRVTTDQTWTSTAGLSGDTFAERGAIFARFTHAGAPAPDVRITEAGAVVSAEDFYFDDADPAISSSVAPGQDRTGPNGAALKILSGLSEHSGTGGEVDGCRWQAELATVVRGVVFVIHRACE